MAPIEEAIYDVIVIGAGPAGEHAADRCRRAGFTTAIVEQELAGGECSYWACMPSKALLRPGQLLATARGVPGVKEAITGALDAQAALGWRNYMVSDWHDDGQAHWITEIGATLYRGHGSIVGDRAVEVTGDAGVTHLSATKAIILATGSSAAMPPIDGLKETRLWDSRGATSSQIVPKSLVVIGGGVVGVEMAQAWRRLGTEKVTILEGGTRLIPNAEPFASDALAEAFTKDGIELLTDAKAQRIHRNADDGPVEITLADGRSVVAEELLVAVGRHPRTEHLGLERFGLTGGKYIPVDDCMRVTAEPAGWLYAIGDINGRALLTHAGKYQGRIAAGAIRGRDVRAEADLRTLPSVVFTDPVVASVGYTEKVAKDKGLQVTTVKVATNSVAGGSIVGESVPGECQLVIDTNEHTVVGATFVGPELTDAIHAATVAIAGRVPMTQLYHAIASFPTLSEVWLELVETYVESAQLFTPQQ